MTVLHWKKEIVFNSLDSWMVVFFFSNWMLQMEKAQKGSHAMLSSSKPERGHLWVNLRLCFEARLKAKPLIGIFFHSHANKIHFHKTRFALSLFLKVKIFGTQKWPITSFYWISPPRKLKYCLNSISTLGFRCTSQEGEFTCTCLLVSSESVSLPTFTAERLVAVYTVVFAAAVGRCTFVNVWRTEQKR